MLKKFLPTFCFLAFYLTSYAQIEKPPVYPGCESESLQTLEACFNTSVRTDILDEFKVPPIVEKENYRGKIKVVFLVTKEGQVRGTLRELHVYGTGR